MDTMIGVRKQRKLIFENNKIEITYDAMIREYLKMPIYFEINGESRLTGSFLLTIMC